MAELRRRPPEQIVYDLVGLTEEEVQEISNALGNDRDGGAPAVFLLLEQEVGRLRPAARKL